MKTRFILINTSHAGNVGATARAMKVMGFDELYLVAPRWANVLRREETIQRSSGAHNVLENTKIVATLDEAVEGLHHLCATAMTPRDFGPPTRFPREHFADLALRFKAGQKGLVNNEVTLEQSTALPPNAGVGFLFGCERYGMSNDDVYRCDVALQIPTNPQFGSLNLSQAVQVLAYEWRMAIGGFGPDSLDGFGQTVTSNINSQIPLEKQDLPELADVSALTGMLQHWQEALIELNYLDPASPKKLMPRLNQLFSRAQLRVEEINILRGIARSILRRNANQAEKP